MYTRFNPSTHLLFPPDDPELLARLARDLAALARGEAPSSTVLAAAPLITDWSLAARMIPVAALTGTVVGHPVITTGHVAITSELFAIDRVKGWARTRSRFYRLGRPEDEGEALQ